MFADKFGIPFFETSAYNGEKIETTFEKLATMILDNMKEVDIGKDLNKGSFINDKKKCC